MKMQKNLLLITSIALLASSFSFSLAEEILKTDTNNDGTTDGWTYVKNGNVQMQEIDINFDGKVDTVFMYEWDGKVKEEILDTDYDGDMDNWRQYEDGKLVVDRLDSDHDGRVDMWFYIDRGRIYKLEKDTTGDGKPDTSQDY
jgi:hypothetical protein